MRYPRLHELYRHSEKIPPEIREKIQDNDHLEEWERILEELDDVAWKDIEVELRIP